MYGGRNLSDVTALPSTLIITRDDNLVWHNLKSRTYFPAARDELNLYERELLDLCIYA